MRCHKKEYYLVPSSRFLQKKNGVIDPTGKRRPAAEAKAMSAGFCLPQTAWNLIAG